MSLYVGMPLLEVMELLESIQLEDVYRNNILNFCKQELQYGDVRISNEIELSMLSAWFNNSDKIAMPELLDGKYSLTDVYYDKTSSGIVTYEEYTSKDKSYYIRSIWKNLEGIVTKVTLAHKTSSLAEMIKNGGTEDFLTDNDNDGFANSRSVIKTSSDNANSTTQMFNDVNLDGKND